MLEIDIPERWLLPPSLEEAAKVQRELAEKVVTEDVLPDTVARIAGTDVSNNLRDPQNMVYAAFTVLEFPGLSIRETCCAALKSPMPYVPGFLAFREIPALVQAYRQLAHPPDLIMVDGHGISHPRGLGIASQLGVLLDRPTIGVAKSILVGRPEGEPGNEPGDYVPLVWKGRTLGAVLRTRANVQPVYVATGHRISLETAIAWVIRCRSGYRLPEPTRQAHAAANACRKCLSPERDDSQEGIQLTFP